MDQRVQKIKQHVSIPWTNVSKKIKQKHVEIPWTNKNDPKSPPRKAFTSQVGLSPISSTSKFNRKQVEIPWTNKQMIQKSPPRKAFTSRVGYHKFPQHNSTDNIAGFSNDAKRFCGRGLF